MMLERQREGAKAKSAGAIPTAPCPHYVSEIVNGARDRPRE